MLKSLYSGISGMKVNQTKLDVIGNNISNVGTTAFKSSNARFSDMLSQSVSDAMAPSSTQGGTNAKQVGLGVQLASIATITTQGNLQLTNRSLDIAIDGKGYLMVSKGDKVFDNSLQVNHSVGAHNLIDQANGSSNQIMFTRDGALTLDEEGNLLTSDGYRVLGYSLTNDDNSKEATGISPNTVNTAGFDFVFGPGSQLNGYKIILGEVGPGTVTSANVDKVGKTIIVNGDFSTVDALTPAQVETAINKALSSAGISQKLSVNGKALNIPNLSSDAVLGGLDAAAPSAISIGGYTIQFNPGDELNEYKFIVDPGAATSVNVDTGNKTITINGNGTNSDIKDAINVALGGEPIKEIQGALSDSVDAPVTSDPIQGGIAKKSPNQVKLGDLLLDIDSGASLNGYKFVIGKISEGTQTSANVDTASKTITINGDFVTAGAISTQNIQNAIAVALSNKGINQTVTVTGTPAQITGVISEETNGGTPMESINDDGSIYFVDATKEIRAYDGELKTLRIPEKVKIAGSDTELRIKSYTIDSSGVINGILEDGTVAALGQIAMASFRNEEGLTKLGGNMYSASVNSGEAVIKSGVGTIYDDNSQGYGDNVQGMLEMSNVDLAEQFTEMIVASRAFQAAGKMITTGDEILQDIINLKR